MIMKEKTTEEVLSDQLKLALGDKYNDCSLDELFRAIWMFYDPPVALRHILRAMESHRPSTYGYCSCAKTSCFYPPGGCAGCGKQIKPKNKF